jgi:hypothetical protein
MRCDACGATNAAGRRFCTACGATLARACAACGFANEPAACFCGGCGARLLDAPAPPAAPGAEAAPERRQATVLFADLVGFTRLTAELGAEDTRSLLDAFIIAP